MARQWSARCYGVARQREGSRQNSIGGSGVLSLRHFSGWFALSLGPRGCRRIWRGVILVYWFWRRDAARPDRAAWAVPRRRSYDLLISGPRVNPIYHPYTRARALMARPWSARCYGVAWQREGSRQNSIGGSGVLSLRHFSELVRLIPWAAWVPKNLARRRMVSAGAMLLDRLGPPGLRFTDFRAPR